MLSVIDTGVIYGVDDHQERTVHVFDEIPVADQPDIRGYLISFESVTTQQVKNLRHCVIRRQLAMKTCTARFLVCDMSESQFII